MTDLRRIQDAESAARDGVFRSIAGPVAIDLAVARYYDAYPLQLAHDFPSESQSLVWHHIGDLLSQAERPGDLSLLDPVRAEDLAPVLAALETDGQLRRGDRARWARREVIRILRARRLGLPEGHPAPMASADEVRRGRMTAL